MTHLRKGRDHSYTSQIIPSLMPHFFKRRCKMDALPEFEWVPSWRLIPLAPVKPSTEYAGIFCSKLGSWKLEQIVRGFRIFLSFLPLILTSPPFIILVVCSKAEEQTLHFGSANITVVPPSHRSGSASQLIQIGNCLQTFTAIKPLTTGAECSVP